MQERCNSIANALELHLSCTNPSILYSMNFVITMSAGVLASPRAMSLADIMLTIELNILFRCLIPSNHFDQLFVNRMTFPKIARNIKGICQPMLLTILPKIIMVSLSVCGRCNGLLDCCLQDTMSCPSPISAVDNTKCLDNVQFHYSLWLFNWWSWHKDSPGGL